jgi:hypothetical protein
VIQLSIPVTMTALDIIKLALTKSHPSVKSSHRCEAIARGLSYLTYASLLADAKAGAGNIASVNGKAFRAYLAQHDFNVPGSALYRAVASAALHGVAERYPTLTEYGFGIGDWNQKDTAETRHKRFADGRADLVSADAAEPFLASLAFVSRAERTKTIRPTTNSYWLKHIAENYACAYPDGEKLGPVYVPNGLLIAAAIQAGFDVKPYADEYGRQTLNAGFNMAKASLYDLDCEIRPDGARAQARRDEERRRSLRRQGFHSSYF